MKFKTIEERVANQRDINAAKAYSVRTSVVADRAESRWANKAWRNANRKNEKVQALWVARLKRIAFLAALLTLLASGVGALA